MKNVLLIVFYFILLNASSQFRFWFTNKQKEMPRYYSYIDSNSIIKDQGDRASCASFAYIALIENELKNISGKEYNLSEQYLTYFLKNNRYKNEDGSIDDCLSLGKQIGFLQEAEWPYHSSYFSPGYPCENYQINDTSTPYYCFAHKTPPISVQQHKIAIDYNYKFSSYNNLKHILKCCSLIYFKQNKYIIAFPLLGFENALKNDGIISLADSITFNSVDNDEFPLHFANIVGYDIDNNWFIVKNSWGNNVGYNGYFYLPFNMIFKYRISFVYLTDFEIKTKDSIIIKYLPEIKINSLETHAMVKEDKSVDISFNANIDSLGYRMLIFESYFYVKFKQGDSIIKAKIKLNKEEVKKFKLEFAGKIKTFSSDSLSHQLILNEKNLNGFNISKELVLCESFQNALKTTDSEILLEVAIKCSDDTFPDKIVAKKYIPLNIKQLLN